MGGPVGGPCGVAGGVPGGAMQSRRGAAARAAAAPSAGESQASVVPRAESAGSAGSAKAADDRPLSGGSVLPLPRALRPDDLLADRLARRISAALGRVVLPLARVAHAFVEERGWFEFGAARLHDYARERLRRSSRWMSDLAALHRAFERLPGLRGALLGTDGGRPLGRVATLLVGRSASAESLAVWLVHARRSPVRHLREAARKARAEGSVWPPGGVAAEGAVGLSEEGVAAGVA